MEIIKHGIDPATQPIFATCSNCKTQVSFLPSEAEKKYDQYGGYQGRGGYTYSVQCPVCRQTIIKNC